jgi:hypothetical protein
MAQVALRPKRGSKKMNYIIDCYKQAHPDEGPDVSPDLVADWAMMQPDLWRPVQISPRDQLKRLVARSLRETYMTDPQGREVRANHPVFTDVMTTDGPRRMARYYPLFQSPAAIARIFFSYKRKAALHDVMQLDLDFESWSDNNVFRDSLDRPDYNFNTDMEELKQPTVYLESLENDDDAEDDEDDF